MCPAPVHQEGYGGDLCEDVDVTLGLRDQVVQNFPRGCTTCRFLYSTPRGVAWSEVI